MTSKDLLDKRVLVKVGHRQGQKGIVSHVGRDGTVNVDFPLGVGGGCEQECYLPEDLHVLGLEVELQKVEPFGTAYGPYRYHP